MIFGDTKAKPFFDGAVYKGEITVHGGHHDRSDVGKWKRGQVGSKAINVQIGGFRVNGPAFQFSSVRDAAIPLQFSQLFEHIGVAKQKRIEMVR